MKFLDIVLMLLRFFLSCFYFLFLIFDLTFCFLFIDLYTLSYIVFRMAQSQPSSGVKGKAIYNKNLSN